MNVFDLPVVETLVRTALAEDLGAGDLTTRLTVPADKRARADISARESAVIAAAREAGSTSLNVFGPSMPRHHHA